MITVDFSRIRIAPGYKILDIGCGSGRHACEAYRFEDVRVVGVDLNPNDLAEARNRLCYHDQLGEHGGGAWALSSADILNLPFADECFDLVICSEVMEHIPDEKRAIQEIIRVLKPGKNIVVSVPRFFPELICWCLSNEYHQANQGHIRIYKKREIIAKLESAGVKIWAEHHAHSLHSPYWWLKCAVGPTRSDSSLVNLYHRFLTWDIMKKPKITRYLDKLLNPLCGKSLVLYFEKK